MQDNKQMQTATNKTILCQKRNKIFAAILCVTVNVPAHLKVGHAAKFKLSFLCFQFFVPGLLFLCCNNIYAFWFIFRCLQCATLPTILMMYLI